MIIKRQSSLTQAQKSRGTEGVTSRALVSAKVLSLSHLRLWELSFVCSLTVFSLGTFCEAMECCLFFSRCPWFGVWAGITDWGKNSLSSDKEPREQLDRISFPGDRKSLVTKNEKDLQVPTLFLPGLCLRWIPPSGGLHSFPFPSHLSLNAN